MQNEAVLISIRPKWCELIANGRKKIELRKTKPKIHTPFKCYIYCTKDKKRKFWIGKKYSYSDDRSHNLFDRCGNGKVIGEFICDAVIPISVEYSDPNNHLANREFPFTCLTDKQIIDYLGNGKTGYGWHISDLVIYDEPKNITDFYKPCIDPYYMYCQECKHGHNVYPSWVETTEDLEGCCFDTECLNFLTKAPQNWCYVKEREQI